MHKNLWCVISAITTCIIVGVCDAANVYIRGDLNLPIYRDFKMNVLSHKTAFRVGGNGAVGVKLNKHFSTELEASIMKIPVTFSVVSGTPASTTLKTTAAFANIYFYPLAKHESNIKPFVGAGIGGGKNKMGDSSSAVFVPGYPGTGLTTPTDPHTAFSTSQGMSSSNLIYQFMTGVEFGLSKHLSLLADIRWLHLGGFKQNYRAVGNKDLITISSQSGRLQMFTANIGFKIIG